MLVGSGIHEFEYPVSVNLIKERINMESTLGIILAEPEAITIFNDLAPGMMDNPLIKLAYGQTVNELTAHMPEGGSDIFFEAIKRLNIEDKQSV